MSGRALREIFADFLVRFDQNRTLERGNRAVDGVRNSLRALDPLVNRLRSGLGTLGVAIGGIAMARQLSGFISETVRIGDELDKTSQQLGISTADLQSFRHAAELSGAGTEQMNVALSQLSNRMFIAHQRGGEAAEVFEYLGVEFRNADGSMRQMGDVMYDISDSLAAMENPTERVAISMQLFGRSGRTLLPMLQGGSDSIRRMRLEFDRLGGGMSQGAIKASFELNDNITRLRLRLLSLRSAIAVRILPAVDWFTRKFIAASQWIERITARSNILEAMAYTLAGTLIILGIATAAAWGPTVLAVGFAIVAFVGLALVVDDLITTMRGGESVTRDFVDALFGIGTTDREVHKIRIGAQLLAAYMRELRDETARAWAIFVVSMQPVTDMIGSVIEAIDRLLARIGVAQGLVGSLRSAAEGLQGIFGGRDALQRMGAQGFDRMQREALARRREGLKTGETQRREAAIEAGKAGTRQPAATRPSVSDRTTSAHPSATTTTRQTTRVDQNVDARMDVLMNITKSTDPQETARIVERMLREKLNRQARDIQAALVPAAEQ